MTWTREQYLEQRERVLAATLLSPKRCDRAFEAHTFQRPVVTEINPPTPHRAAAMNRLAYLSTEGVPAVAWAASGDDYWTVEAL